MLYPFCSGLSRACARDGPALPQLQGPGYEKTLSRSSSSDQRPHIRLFGNSRPRELQPKDHASPPADCCRKGLQGP